MVNKLIIIKLTTNMLGVCIFFQVIAASFEVVLFLFIKKIIPLALVRCDIL